MPAVAQLTNEPEVVQYESVIPWPRLKEHLEFKAKEAEQMLFGAQTLEQLHEAKGALKFAQKMLNLPATLAFIDQNGGPAPTKP